TAMETLARFGIVLLIGCAILAPRAELRAAADPAEQPVRISLEPGDFTLIGVRAQQQLTVTGTYASGEVRDLTADAVYSSSAPAIAAVEHAIVRSAGDGAAVVTARLGDLSASVAVTVTKMNQPTLVSFKNETLAALTKAGCN